MIKLYTTYNTKNKKILNDQDSFFYENVLAADFEEDDLWTLQEIDHAVVLDAELGKIKTDRGICSIENLSTGCKTVLNYLFLRRNRDIHIDAINISFCGSNALDILFAIAEKDEFDIDFLLFHQDNLFKCKNRKYLINGEKIIDNLLYL